ncbi:Uncharacterised protein [Chryseobacterium nakagawai]|nr:Uncharacterised protein [Chryseobacterium nakagawai]
MEAILSKTGLFIGILQDYQWFNQANRNIISKNDANTINIYADFFAFMCKTT